MEEPPTPCRKRPCWFSLYSYILDLSFFLAAGISVQVILTEWQLFNLVPLIRSCRHNLHMILCMIQLCILFELLYSQCKCCTYLIINSTLLGSWPKLVKGNNFYSSASNQISFTLSLSGTLWQRLYANRKNISSFFTKGDSWSRCSRRRPPWGLSGRSPRSCLAHSSRCLLWTPTWNQGVSVEHFFFLKFSWFFKFHNFLTLQTAWHTLWAPPFCECIPWFRF